MVYQHPLAFLLGLEGAALLRAFAGEYDRAFVEARIAEIRRLLDDPALQIDGVDAERVGTVDGYRIWSRTYDEPGNGAFAYEEPYVREILDGLPAGVALDAACGTGRWAADLAARGHDVIGVDSSPDMLDRARIRVPTADFRRGDLHALPVDEAAADVIVCALALTHVPDLGPAFTEFARVLRPGGHLVVSDMHHLRVALGSVPHVRSADGEPGLLPAYRHLTGDYLTVALPLGLQVRSCAEPRLHPGTSEPSGEAERPGTSEPSGEAERPGNSEPSGEPQRPGDREPSGDSKPPAEDGIGAWDVWPWTLPALIPEAGGAAGANSPVTVVWHFQLSDG